ncbi:putative quinol monooxygenase [Mucilaginibacter terrae]|uniref:putative quinol monooxygenase n=1 Tax=Mucilaginibacter terrae TaxID=1955052 RepID=UPI003632DD1F
MSVKVITILHCNHDAEDTFEQELKRLVEASVHDEGCIEYQLNQYKDEPCCYIIIACWQNEKALIKHRETRHYKHFVRVIPVLLLQPPHIKTLVRLA